MQEQIERFIINQIRCMLGKEVDSDVLFIEMGIDSLLIIQLLVELEKEFDIEFSDEDLNFEQLSSAKCLANLVDRLINHR